MAAARLDTPLSMGVESAAVTDSGVHEPRVTNSKTDRFARKEWVRLLTATLARTILIIVVSMAAWGSLPALLGWTPTTVMSGSMEPKIRTGDVVVARPTDPSEYKPSRVLLVDDPDRVDKLRLHRLVRINDDGALVLRGDANNTEDSSTVSTSAVHGVGFLRVPYVGLPVYWIAAAEWLKLLLAAGFFIILCWATTLDRTLQRSRHRGEPPARGSKASAELPTTVGGLETLGLAKGTNRVPMAFDAPGPKQARPTGRRSARLGAAVVASALALGTVPVASQAAFSSTSSNTANTFKSDKFLTCGAAIMSGNPNVFYQFDRDTASTVLDSSGNNVDATFNAPSAPRDFGRHLDTDPIANPFSCKSDGGVTAKFVGTNSITRSQDYGAAPQTFSYEMWFRTNGVNSQDGGKLMSFGVKGGANQTPTRDNRVLYLLPGGRLRFGLEQNTGNMLTSSPVDRLFNDGKWHHVAVAFTSTAGALNGGKMAIYTDGLKAHGELESIPLKQANPDSQGAWTVGSGVPTSWQIETTKNGFVGEIDNVAIYQNRALSLAEAAAHHAAGRTAKQQP